MTRPAYYMRAGKPYCPDCAAGFFGAPFPVGVIAGPMRECAKCGVTMPQTRGRSRVVRGMAETPEPVTTDERRHTMTKEERFHYLQTKWQEAEERKQEYAYTLKRQYGDARGYCWDVPAGKRARQDRLEAAESKACERFLSFLKALNPDRHWSTGFPIGFLMDSLTYADATTRARMSMTPPPAYGFTPQDAEAFAAPLK